MAHPPYNEPVNIDPLRSTIIYLIFWCDSGGTDNLRGNHGELFRAILRFAEHLRGNHRRIRLVITPHFFFFFFFFFFFCDLFSLCDIIVSSIKVTA